MVLNRTRWLLSCLIVALLAFSVPAAAHKDHNKHRDAERSMAVPGHTMPMPSEATSRTNTSGAAMDTVHERAQEEAPLPFFERLLDWLGRLHPIVVHFPIAFFPTALFTAIVGRRRPSFAAPVQFMVVTGGIIAPLSAVFGWLDASGMDPDPLLTVHRWLGTTIGVMAVALATWAWRKPEQDRSGLMIAFLTVITAAIVVQGWYGGALVHGMDHMNW